MKAEDKRFIDQHTRALEGLAREGKGDEETQVYFIAPGFLTKFDRECGEGANLASVYVIDAHDSSTPGLHLADLKHPERSDKAGGAVHGQEVAHLSTLNFLLVPAKKAHVEEAGAPVLIFLIYKSVFTHAGLLPYSHRPAFTHALSRFIDVQVLAS